MNNPDQLPKFNELTELQQSRVTQLTALKPDHKKVPPGFVNKEQAILIVLASELSDSPQRKKAIDLLFDDDWYKYMRRFAMSEQKKFQTPNPGMANAIVHEAYFSLQDKIRCFEGRSQFETWCCGFIRNKVREEKKKNDFTVKFNKEIGDYNDLIKREAEIAKETGKPKAPKRIKLPITKHEQSITNFDDQSGESDIDFFDRNAKTPEELLELKQEMGAKFSAISEVIDEMFLEFFENDDVVSHEVLRIYHKYFEQDRLREIDDLSKSTQKEVDGRVNYQDIANEYNQSLINQSDLINRGKVESIIEKFQSRLKVKISG